METKEKTQEKRERARRRARNMKAVIRGIQKFEAARALTKEGKWRGHDLWKNVAKARVALNFDLQEMESRIFFKDGKNYSYGRHHEPFEFYKIVELDDSHPFSPFAKQVTLATEAFDSLKWEKGSTTKRYKLGVALNKANRALNAAMKAARTDLHTLFLYPDCREEGFAICNPDEELDRMPRYFHITRI